MVRNAATAAASARPRAIAAATPGVRREPFRMVVDLLLADIGSRFMNHESRIMNHE
jgi:hypothetical protein